MYAGVELLCEVVVAILAPAAVADAWPRLSSTLQGLRSPGQRNIGNKGVGIDGWGQEEAHDSILSGASKGHGQWRWNYRGDAVQCHFNADQLLWCVQDIALATASTGFMHGIRTWLNTPGASRLHPQHPLKVHTAAEYAYSGRAGTLLYMAAMPTMCCKVLTALPVHDRFCFFVFAVKL